MAAVLVVSSLVTGCAGAGQSGVDSPKVAATFAVAQTTVNLYNHGAQAADATRDAGALATVESGSALQIHQGLYEVATTLDIDAQWASGYFALPDVVFAPAFDGYPMWFAASTTDQGKQTKALLLFTRQTSLTPWVLAAAPRLAVTTELPAVAIGAEGNAVTADPDDSVGLSGSVNQALTRFADVLGDVNSAYAEDFEDDAFIASARAMQSASQPANVVFSQTWQAEPVVFALRLADGGALVFATLRRIDHYTVVGKGVFAFDPQSAEGAFVPGKIRDSAEAAFVHQVVLVFAPDGKPHAIGQYDGITGARGT